MSSSIPGTSATRTPLSAMRSGRSDANLPAGAGVRLSILLLLLIAVIAAGYMAGRVTIELAPGLTQFQVIAALAMTCAGIFGALALLVSTISVLRFIRCGFSFFGNALVSLIPAALLFAIVGFGAAMVRPPALPPATESPQLGVLFGFAGRNDTIYVPYFPHEGRANGSCDVNHRFDEKYASPPAGIRNSMLQLGKSLASCGAAGRHMTVDVVGFASNSEFAKCVGPAPTDSPDSTLTDLLNRNLAEARRKAVIDLLNEGAAQARTEFEAKRGKEVVAHWVIDYEPEAAKPRWLNRKQMQDDPQFAFNDREIVNVAPAYDSLRGGLTRRVDVVIKSKGACAL